MYVAPIRQEDCQVSLRSLRQGFQQQTLTARHKRAVRRWYREARRTAQLREREQRLAYGRAIHSRRMSERKRELAAAQRDRVAKHKAMLARRQAKLQGKRARKIART